MYESCECLCLCSRPTFQLSHTLTGLFGLSRPGPRVAMCAARCSADGCAPSGYGLKCCYHQRVCQIPLRPTRNASCVSFHELPKKLNTLGRAWRRRLYTHTKSPKYFVFPANDRRSLSQKARRDERHDCLVRDGVREKRRSGA